MTSSSLASFLLLVSGGFFMAQFTNPQHTGAIASLSCPKSDSFSGTGTLSSCWAQTTASGYGTLHRHAGGATVSTGTKGIATYTGASFATTQTSTVSASSGLANTTGPVVLGQINGAGYVWVLSAQNLVPINSSGVTQSPITACPVVSAGDVVKLSATVTASVPTLTCLNVTTGLSNIAADTNSCSGSPCSITGVPGAMVSGSDLLTSFVGT